MYSTNTKSKDKKKPQKTEDRHKNNTSLILPPDIKNHPTPNPQEKKKSRTTKKPKTKLNKERRTQNTRDYKKKKSEKKLDVHTI